MGPVKKYELLNYCNKYSKILNVISILNISAYRWIYIFNTEFIFQKRGHGREENYFS